MHKHKTVDFKCEIRYNKSVNHTLRSNIKAIFLDIDRILKSDRFIFIIDEWNCVFHKIKDDKAMKKLTFDVMITEDTKSGYEFYSNYFKNTNVTCLSSESNSTVFKLLKEHH